MLAHGPKGGSSNIELLTQFAAHAVCATHLNEYPVYSLAMPRIATNTMNREENLNEDDAPIHTLGEQQRAPLRPQWYPVVGRVGEDEGGQVRVRWLACVDLVDVDKLVEKKKLTLRLRRESRVQHSSTTVGSEWCMWEGAG